MFVMIARFFAFLFFIFTLCGCQLTTGMDVPVSTAGYRYLLEEILFLAVIAVLVIISVVLYLKNKPSAKSGAGFGLHYDNRPENAARELLESRQRLELLFHMNPVPTGIFLLDSGEFISMNPAFRKALGIAPDIPPDPRKDGWELYPPGADKAEIMNSLVHTGEAAAEDVPFIRCGGEKRLSDRHYRLLGNDKDRAVLVLQDTTVIRASLDELSRSNERYRLLSEITTDAASFSRIMDGGLLVREWATDKLIRSYGYTLEDIDSLDKWQKIVYPPDLPAFMNAVRTFIGGKRVSEELRIVTGSGELRWINNTVHPQVDSVTGRVTALLSAIKDITEKKNAELALKASEEKYRSLVNISADAIIMTDMAGTIITANQAAADLFGYVDPLELTGAGPGSDGAIIPPDRVRELGERLVNEKKISNMEVRSKRKDGKDFTAEFSASLFTDGNGNPSGVVAVIRDVTDRVTYEDRLKSMNALLEEMVAARTRELEQLNRELEGFSYSVSHDLKAPLRVVQGFINALSETKSNQLDEEGRSYLRESGLAAAKMSGLIDDLLNLSRITRQELELLDVDLSETAAILARDLDKEYGRPARSWNIEPRIKVKADPRLIRIVLRNLLENACKFTSNTDQPVITVKVMDYSGKDWVLVRDNGAGFNPRYKERLFIPFQRLHSESEYSGNGIGLSIVKRIIEKHGGQIDADGRPGGGAEFRFTLS